MKPDWKDAPEWAKWLAMDSDGKWCWFEQQPEVNDEFRWDSCCNGRWEETTIPNWKYSLESRPDDKQ